MKKLLLSLILGIFLISLVSAAPFNWTNNIISYWNFNGNANDLLGINNWTTIGSLSTVSSCTLNTCLKLSGNSSANYLNKSSFINTDVLPNGTYYFWYKRDTNNPSSICLNGKGVVGVSTSYRQCVNSTGSLTSNIANDQVTSNTSFTVNQFHLITITWNTSTTFIYQDLNNIINHTNYVIGAGGGDNGDNLFTDYNHNTEFVNLTIDEGALFNRTINRTEVYQIFNGGNGLGYGNISYDYQPTITLNYPQDSFLTSNTSIFFNASLDILIGEYKNATLYIWYQNGTLFNVTTNILSGGNITKNTNWSISNFNINNYLWNVYGCAANASASSCQFASSNRSFTWGISIQDVNYSYNVYETDNDILNVTFNISSTPTAYLYWQGTSYSATITNLSGGIWKAEKNLSIPSSTGTKNLFWEIRSGGLNYNTSSYNQIVNATNLTLCSSSPYNTPFINFTFKNETTLQEDINATVASTWYYYLGDGSVSKSLSYTSTNELRSYGFCGVPTSRTIRGNLTMYYDNAESQQRTYTLSNFALTSSVTSTTLYLLPTGSGLYVTFQVVNPSGQSVSGALVTATKAGYTPNSGYTDDSGSITFFLDPLSIYTITASKSGYDSSTSSIIPTQSSYTITLGSQTSTTQNDYSRGISYIITPTSSYLINNTNYAFNFTLNSSYWEVTSFGFIISNGSSELANVGMSGNGGALSTTLNTGQNRTLYVNYFWVINGTYSNITKVYSVFNDKDTQYSIKNFFDNFRTYTDQGIFGITAFGRTLLVFLIIFITVGILSYKFGLESPTAIIGLSFFMVFFFDNVINLIASPLPGNPNLPVATIIVGLIFIATYLREVTR